MNSFDTNVLLYALNRDCPEHAPARRVVEDARSHPTEWIVADQVYFELYRLLRNPVVLERPLSGSQAAEAISFYRNRTGWGRCGWETGSFARLAPHLRSDDLPAVGVFDLVLAETLRAAGVKTLYTRNIRDFQALKLFDVVDPIA